MICCRGCRIRTASFDANDLNAKKLAVEVDTYEQDKETDEAEWKMRYTPT